MSNAHSHNDYQQQRPFFQAYNEQFGSIEVDIHLAGKELLVAHDSIELTQMRTLEKFYLSPIASIIAKNNGSIYPDSTKKLQLLVDLKTEATSTLDALVKLLNKYPVITSCRSLQIVITGNRPMEKQFNLYPAFIWFDGKLDGKYNNSSMKKIALLSDNFEKYTTWKGKGAIANPDRERLTAAIQEGHKAGKPVRFWGSPDFYGAWRELTALKVDYINTDQVAGLAEFLQLQQRSSIPAR